MKFFVTFGQKYRTIPHPVFGGIHPDGYITIESENKEYAQLIVDTLFEKNYSNIYAEDEIKTETLERNFPVGNLKTITAENFLNKDLWGL